jgi:hypothetical protein
MNPEIPRPARTGKLETRDWKPLEAASRPCPVVQSQDSETWDASLPACSCVRVPGVPVPWDRRTTVDPDL